MSDKQKQTYTWIIEYILKNGEHLYAEYNGTERTSAEVVNRLLSNERDHFSECRTVDNRGSIYVRSKDVAALKVIVPEGASMSYVQ